MLEIEKIWLIATDSTVIDQCLDVGFEGDASSVSQSETESRKSALST